MRCIGRIKSSKRVNRRCPVSNQLVILIKNDLLPPGGTAIKQHLVYDQHIRSQSHLWISAYLPIFKGLYQLLQLANPEMLT